MSSSLIDLITQQLSGTHLGAVSQQLGTDPATAGSAIQAALPVLVSALAKNAATPEGAGALAAALDRDHDGSILNDLSGALGNFQSGPGGAILKHVLGARQGGVEQGLSQATGLPAGAAGSLLQMLAPVVMGALGGIKRQSGLDAGGLASMLGQAHQQAAAAPGGFGSLLGLLDRDHDGSVIDDVARMAGQLFRR